MSNNKNIKKTGFSLAEVIIAMAIVGVAMVVAMTTVRSPNDAALKYLYISAYKSLAKAYYNGTLIGYNPFSEDKVKNESGSLVTPVHTSTQDTGSLVLCRGLTSYINTNTNEKTADYDYSSTCSSEKLSSSNASDSDFTSDKVMFTATNGMRFFITNRLGGGQDTQGNDNPYFYIVYVDVNGVNGPNSLGENFSPQNGERSITPDIFAFAMLDSGKVCPLGIPEYDEDILTAKFIYGAEGDRVGRRSLAYYQAKGAAWGFYGTDDSLAQDPMEAYNTSEPFSMNDKIRSMLPPDSNIVRNFPNLRNEDPVALANGNDPEDIPYDCSNEDLESCYIFLDEYKK